MVDTEKSSGGTQNNVEEDLRPSMTNLGVGTRAGRRMFPLHTREFWKGLPGWLRFAFLLAIGVHFILALVWAMSK